MVDLEAKKVSKWKRYVVEISEILYKFVALFLIGTYNSYDFFNEFHDQQGLNSSGDFLPGDYKDSEKAPWLGAE